MISSKIVIKRSRIFFSKSIHWHTSNNRAFFRVQKCNIQWHKIHEQWVGVRYYKFLGFDFQRLLCFQPQIPDPSVIAYFSSKKREIVKIHIYNCSIILRAHILWYISEKIWGAYSGVQASKVTDNLPEKSDIEYILSFFVSMYLTPFIVYDLDIIYIHAN